MKTMKSIQIAMTTLVLLSASSVLAAEKEAGVLDRVCMAVGLCETPEQKAAKVEMCGRYGFQAEQCSNLSGQELDLMKTLDRSRAGLAKSLEILEQDKKMVNQNLIKEISAKDSNHLSSQDTYWYATGGLGKIPTARFYADSSKGLQGCESMNGHITGCENLSATRTVQRLIGGQTPAGANGQIFEAVGQLVNDDGAWLSIFKQLNFKDMNVSAVEVMLTGTDSEGAPRFLVTVREKMGVSSERNLKFGYMLSFVEYSPTSHGLAYQLKSEQALQSNGF